MATSKKAPRKKVAAPRKTAPAKVGAAGTIDPLALSAEIASARSRLAELEKNHQQALAAQADSAVDEIATKIREYAPYLTRSSKAKLLAALQVVPVKATASKANGSANKVPPKYRLPTGETWTGRGKPPRSFAQWKVKNPGKDYPPV